MKACCPTCHGTGVIDDGEKDAVHAMAAAMRERGFHVAPDGTVSGDDLRRFKGWTIHQLKRWRDNDKLPKADALSKPARYSLQTVVNAIRGGEIF